MPYTDARRVYVNLGNADLVPKEYYAMDILLSRHPYNLSKQEIHDIRLGSYRKAKAKIGDDNQLAVASWWNTNVSELGNDINLFLGIELFAPIANRVVMFEKKSEKKTQNLHVTKKISFGILKTEYDSFLKTGTVTSKLPNFKNDEDRVPQYAQIACGNTSECGERIVTRNVPVVQLWKTWCKANGYKQSDAILQAMKLQIQANPGKAELPPLEEFMDGHKVDDYFYQLPPQQYEGDKRRIRIRLNADRATLENTKTMLVRYNRYADLNGVKKLTMYDYLNLALSTLNNAMLKKLLPYSKEYQEYEKDLEFYERTIKKGR